MARKRSRTGPTENRTEEEAWQPSEADGPLRRTLDKAVEVEIKEDDFGFIYGDIVQDAEAEDPEHSVVVNIPGVTAEEWEYEEDTLADRNADYPSDDDVVVVVGRDVLDDYLPDWDQREEDIPLERLRDDGVPSLVFPSLRLILVEKSHLRE